MSLFRDLCAAPSGTTTAPSWDDNPGKSGGFILLSKQACTLVFVDVTRDFNLVFCGRTVDEGGNKLCFCQD